MVTIRFNEVTINKINLNRNFLTFNESIFIIDNLILLTFTFYIKEKWQNSAAIFVDPITLPIEKNYVIRELYMKTKLISLLNVFLAQQFANQFLILENTSEVVVLYFHLLFVDIVTEQCKMNYISEDIY